MKISRSMLHILLFSLFFHCLFINQHTVFQSSINSENHDTTEISIQDEYCPEDPPERSGNQECEKKRKFFHP